MSSESIPYAVHVRDLTIQAPVPQVTIPLAVPIVVPNRLVRLFKGKAKEGDIDYSVQKELVKHADVRVEPGEVCAIMGGSGSGKTTLLNAIAHRLGNLEIKSGSVDFVARSSAASQVKASQLSKVIGFVRQDDFLLSYLTVYETLDFAASLRLPSSTPKAVKRGIIDKTISELGLTDVRDVIVGGPFRKGISGGEKRRLSIGCVLVSMPSVLILDEPTTGLDSFSAYQLLDTLSKLARRGRSVILSIHQPRSDAFGLFDKITLLSRGDVVYSAKTKAMLPYFEAQGLALPEHTNPLDFVIDISSIDSRTDEAETLTSERVGRLVRAWKQEQGNVSPHSVEHVVNSRSLSMKAQPLDIEKGSANIVRRLSSEPDSEEYERTSLKRPNLLSQAILLTRRNLLNVSRNYGQSIGFLAQAIIVGVVLGLAFLTPPETPGGIQSLKTVLYQSGPAMFYLYIIVYVFILTNELVVFDRDREDGLYGTVPATFAYFTSYLPLNIVVPTIYAIILYFMCGFRRDSLAVNLLSFIANCILLQLCSFSYALLCSALNRSFAQASLLANGFSIMFLLSAGYLIVNLPVWVAWTRWLSFYYYSFHWNARLQFTGRDFACEGVTGPARNQCVGTNVLVGLKFPLSNPLFIYPLGLLGFVVACMMLAVVVLKIYHPGGVKHAVSQPPKRNEVAGIEKSELAKLKTRTKVDVRLERFKLTVSRRSRLTRRTLFSKDILEEVNAVFPSGQVSVVMGPSGSGKTSLLQSLSGRLSSKAMSRFKSKGRIMFNDSEYNEQLASLVAFVEQEDAHHMPALTVRETLQYAAMLRMRGYTKSQCYARAEEVMRMLGLKACADNLVGGPLLKGISGGEKRRLSLAVELISDPAVLYADEPLSGLDSFSAHNVMLCLKALAATGRTVVCSVHQPRSDIWDLFDNVLLLAKGGRTAYSGPRSEILKFFDSACYACPPNYNAADFVLDTISVNTKSEAEATDSKQRVLRVLDIWAQRSAQSHSKQTSALTTATGLTDNRAGEFKRDSAPFSRAFPIVLARSVKNLRRQSDAFVARVSNPPFLALIFFLFFGRLKLGPAASQDRIGLLQETTAMPFVGMLACIAIFPSERALYFHEYKSSARQSVTTFILAYTVQETLTSLFSSLLFSVVFVFGPGLQWKGQIFVEFWIAIWALLSAGESIGIAFSAYFEDGGLAVSLVSACITLAAQLNGIISVTLPKWLKVIGWASIMKPQARLQIINEMTGLTFDCTAADISNGSCLATTGEQVLQTFGIPPGGTGKLMGIMIALVVIYRALAWLAVRIRVSSL